MYCLNEKAIFNQSIQPCINKTRTEGLCNSSFFTNLNQCFVQFLPRLFDMFKSCADIADGKAECQLAMQFGVRNIDFPSAIYLLHDLFIQLVKRRFNL